MDNYLVRALSNDKSFRAFALKATDVIAEVQERHDTWSSSTVALGRTMLGALLLGANLKGNDKLTVKVAGNGSGGMIVVDADAKGNVKGYIDNPHVDLRKTSTNEVIVNQATGNRGMFAVIKDMGLKDTYSGQVPFVSGEIGEEFTYYLTESEQTPSSVGLNVKLDEEQRVRVAGGFLVQVMPGAQEESIQKLEQTLQQLPAISDILMTGTPEDLLDAIFGADAYKTLDKMPVQFFCNCSKERFGAGLVTLGKEELNAIIEEDGKAEVVCHFCGEKYQFTKEELISLRENAK